jgi:predicted nucleotidyltransferase
MSTVQRIVEKTRKECSRAMKIEDKYQTAVDEFLRRVLEKYRERIESIILFGLVAQGDARKNTYSLK